MTPTAIQRARTGRVVDLHGRLFCDLYEPETLRLRIEAVARMEFFEAELLRNPAADVDELTCPDQLIPTWDDLFRAPKTPGAWRPSKAADAESFRLAAQWSAWREYGREPEPTRDTLAPIVAEWQREVGSHRPQPPKAVTAWLRAIVARWQWTV